MDRGMIKWKPFNTLLNSNDMHMIELERKKIDKPVIMEDRILEINDVLTMAITENMQIKVKYFSKGFLLNKSGTIDKVNILEKYILVNNARIYFRDIINITYV